MANVTPKMPPHVKIYHDENNITPGDIILCEIRAEGCKNVAVDICHIEHRGMGGDATKDVNENLVAGCRPCHNKVDASLIDKEELKLIAKRRIDANDNNTQI